MTSPPTRKLTLDGAHAKLGRANEHVGLLQASSERNTPPVQLRQRHELDPSGQTLRVAAEIATVPAFPTQWSLVIGDAAQNLRAALDYLVYELIALETGSYFEKSQFPIAKRRAAHNQRERETIKRLGRHWSVIERYQPYGGSEPPTLSDSLFQFLQAFSNQDKHRLLVPAAASIELNQSLAILMPIAGRRTTPTAINVGALEPGAELVAETFLVTGPNPRVYMSELYTPLVCFAEIPTVSIAELLGMMHAKAANLIGKFTSLF